MIIIIILLLLGKSADATSKGHFASALPHHTVLEPQICQDIGFMSLLGPVLLPGQCKFLGKATAPAHRAASGENTF